MQVYSTLRQLDLRRFTEADRKYIRSVSGLISRDGPSPASLSSAEAAELMETFRKVFLPRWTLPGL